VPSDQWLEKPRPLSRKPARCLSSRS
jgi:hypothetical protein